jgi:uncharacterized surface protein with fasciclin (FAS1) repeats
MYKIWTSSKALLNVAALSLAVTLSTSAVAGPGKPGQQNIAEIAQAAGFNTLYAAATCDYFDGDVAALLTGDDKITVFAPNDEAFAALGLDETTICTAFEGDPTTLLTILAYHVVDGRRFSNSVFNRNNPKMIETMIGQYLTTNSDFTIHTTSGQDPVTLGDAINVNASNGVIHEVNAVLFPVLD